MRFRTVRNIADTQHHLQNHTIPQFQREVAACQERINEKDLTDPRIESILNNIASIQSLMRILSNEMHEFSDDEWDRSLAKEKELENANKKN